MNGKDISLLDHIEELRSRLLKCALCVLFCGGVVFHFNETILGFLARPVGKLVFIEPVEAFTTYIKVAFWGGLFLASPYCIFQIWRFVEAGLEPKEKRFVYVFLPASFLLFVTGVVFGFIVIISVGIRFLLSFGGNFMTPMISISKYVSFVGAMSLAFGVVFQLPLVMLFLTKVGLLRPLAFSSKRRYVIVAIFIASGILTPSPDVFSQLSMAIPLLFLYEIGIVLSKVAYRRRMAAEEASSLCIQAG